MKGTYNKETGKYEQTQAPRPKNWVVKNPTEPYVKEKYNYDDMLVKELKDLARERKLVGFSKLKKAELIQLLKDNE
jgi:hypothetical protein